MALVGSVAIAAFLVGYVVAGMGSDTLTREDLVEILAEQGVGQTQGDVVDTQFGLPAQISIDDDPVIGSPDAPITIIEFSDFQCPFCANFNANTLPLISEHYIETGLVKLVYRDFPIQEIHPNAVAAAVAAECAHEQGQFKPMHDMLFASQDQWGGLDAVQAGGAFSQYASQLGLDSASFDECLVTDAYMDEVMADLQDGLSYGTAGTPTFFIGNADIGYSGVDGAQPFDVFERILNDQLGE